MPATFSTFGFFGTMPSFSYHLQQHVNERELLKKFFETAGMKEKEKTREKYNHLSFAHHRRIRERFLHTLGEDHDLVIGYFSVADVIGHLNFGNMEMMRMIYMDLDDIAREARKKCKNMLVLSDHGMHGIGNFGDHSEYGFWSTSTGEDLGSPKITDLHFTLLRWKGARG